jgi:hypothetical protein
MSEDTKTDEQIQVEKEARLMGWVEKEDYRDGDHWVDAEAFVKRGKEINPILRKNNETLLKKLEAANLEVAEIKKVAKEFEKFQKEAADRKVGELTKELNELREKKKIAVSSGDGEAVVLIDEAIDAVKEQQVEAKKVPEKAPEKPPVTLDPLVTEWMDKNTWFTADDKYTRIADAIGTSINANFPHLSGKAFFEKLDEELEEVLPAKYKKTQRSSPVESGTGSSNRPTGSSTKQSYANLPADAKAACDRYVKQGLMTKEAYVESYDWS